MDLVLTTYASLPLDQTHIYQVTPAHYHPHSQNTAVHALDQAQAQADALPTSDEVRPPRGESTHSKDMKEQATSESPRVIEKTGKQVQLETPQVGAAAPPVWPTEGSSIAAGTSFGDIEFGDVYPQAPDDVYSELQSGFEETAQVGHVRTGTNSTSTSNINSSLLSWQDTLEGCLTNSTQVELSSMFKKPSLNKNEKGKERERDEDEETEKERKRNEREREKDKFKIKEKEKDKAKDKDKDKDKENVKEREKVVVSATSLN